MKNWQVRYWVFRACEWVLLRSNYPLNCLDRYFWVRNKYNTGLGGRLSLRLLGLTVDLAAWACIQPEDFMPDRRSNE